MALSSGAWRPLHRGPGLARSRLGGCLAGVDGPSSSTSTTGLRAWSGAGPCVRSSRSSGATESVLPRSTSVRSCRQVRAWRVQGQCRGTSSVVIRRLRGVWSGAQGGAEQAADGTDQSLGPAAGEVKHRARRQRGQDGERPSTPARFRAPRSPPVISRSGDLVSASALPDGRRSRCHRRAAWL